MGPLQTVFPMLIVIALIAVFIVLMVGVIGMARGGEFNRRYGNTLMRLRVGIQAFAVLLIVIYVAVIHGG